MTAAGGAGSGGAVSLVDEISYASLMGVLAGKGHQMDKGCLGRI